MEIILNFKNSTFTISKYQPRKVIVLILGDIAVTIKNIVFSIVWKNSKKNKS